ncbi:hypothetical protein CFC21_106360 [Triticum aestivum]|uniref:Disease resistance protein At4g27190-like leucine-rich repeats domain-containing protein n=2 Tax=Triticum aestivum TaxID=4565 RepID=A0A3B6TGA5_WHEAT|nr:uncharacterized protein LOC123170538 [Triticum aestivum]XP_044444332.1 uncharacterized protein LOC123170538 [Triticum aestivum]XP_044444333.1 uncharacterized protein LOC123170538 [Triticum aestivum]KAF7105569.1 hypothetical protein CFC21_106360 [Triticum aestivum]
MDHPIELEVHDFDDAPRKLLDLMLRLESNKGAKSFFFGGWLGCGVGASAVLKATSELLKSERSDPDMTEHFDKIIHVDCSMWKNRRTMQRAIAEELNLHRLMHMFDKQDEDDDFRGIDVSSRVEIPSIGREINASLRNERFLLIFHYGGEEDIDLTECGIPNPDFGTYALGLLLWTNYGRFQLSERKEKVNSSPSYFKTIYLCPNEDDHSEQLLYRLLHEEATEVIGYTGMDDIKPSIVLDCFLYSLFLTGLLHKKPISVDYDWDTHACNYWICDDILQGEKSCEVGNALYGVIQLLCNPSKKTKRLAEHFGQRRDLFKRWISISSNQLGEKDISAGPVNASSYFVTFGGDGKLQIPNGLFQLANNLRVLKLCNCSFNFPSPPFICCHNLKFLWLDHCTNTGEEQGGAPCFPNMSVLDIRFTDFALLAYMIELMTNLKEVNTMGVSWRTVSHAWKKLQNLHKLRVTESLDVITVETCSSVDMMNLELLDLSGNIHMESLPEISSAENLKVLILDGCSSLEHVAIEGAPPSLESFSFDGYGPAEKWTHPIELPKRELRPKSYLSIVQEAKVRRISLKGCAQLRNIFFRALPNLEELDLSDTSIETLDLRAMDVPRLKKLFLLGCEQLCSLLWNEGNRSLRVLHVDTRGKTRSTIYHGEQMPSSLEEVMAFIEGRFLLSAIMGLSRITWPDSKIHIHISSKIHNRVNITKSMEDIGPIQEGMVPIGLFLPYSDIVLSKDVVTRSFLVWDRRQLYPLGMHIEIGEGSHHLESINDKEFREGLTQVKSLHVHDNISITVILPAGSRYWNHLEWCHVERCPKLHTLFPCWGKYRGFESLRIFSAVDLPMVHCIWDRVTSYKYYYNFDNLQHIYLHNCPRLVFVHYIRFALYNLETIQIAHCPNLQHIFPLDDKHFPPKRYSSVRFNKLKHIKLYHLHKLEQICDATVMWAPALETVSLRDCWGLRRLPVASRYGPKPVVDCEKDWWDMLEWDNFWDHDPSLFETRHSSYYKNALPRVSVLR